MPMNRSIRAPGSVHRLSISVSPLPPRSPVNRTATYLDAMGVVVDQTSYRLYVREHARAIPMTDLFGIKIPMSVVSLSALTARAGQHSPVSGAEVLAACGFPSADRAALHLPLPAHQRQERDAEEEKKERHL